MYFNQSFKIHQHCYEIYKTKNDLRNEGIYVLLLGTIKPTISQDSVV